MAEAVNRDSQLTFIWEFNCLRRMATIVTEFWTHKR